MNRVIKFRVWDPRIGYYRKRDEWAITSDGQPLRYFEPEEGGYDVPRDEGLMIEQFTGLKDSQGKDIYEGDIIQFAFGTGIDFDNIRVVTAHVVFDDKLCAFMFRSVDKSYMVIDPNPGSLKVVGNMHEDQQRWFGEARA